MVWIKFNWFRVITDRHIKLLKLMKSASSTAICLSTFWMKLNGSCKLIDSLIKFALFSFLYSLFDKTVNYTSILRRNFSIINNIQSYFSFQWDWLWTRLNFVIRTYWLGWWRQWSSFIKYSVSHSSIGYNFLRACNYFFCK